MFTGIVEELGIVKSKTKIAEGISFSISSKKIGKKLKVSDSVCVNGVCHTVTAKNKDSFDFISVHETLKKTNIGKLSPGDEVNLENSLVIGQQIGGHFVFGHIDDTGTVTSVKQVKSKSKKSADKKSQKSGNWEYKIKIHKKHSKFVIYVGSIAINGVSLTIAEVSKPKGKYFEIKTAIIPFTYSHTTFKNLKINDKVNLEFDFLGKYVQNILEKKSAKKKK
jgi:riboflavin synthase